MHLIDCVQEISVYRPLGSWEQVLWLCDKAQPTHFSLTAQIRGEFSALALKQALAQVQQRHPLLRVRIALDEAERPWFVKDSANIPLRVIQRQSEKHWQRELEQELSKPFAWTQAPLVRVVLLHSTDVSELIVTCHHSIADGMSALYLIRDILQAIANRDAFLQPLPALPPMEDLIPGKVYENLLPYPTLDNASSLNRGTRGMRPTPRHPIFKSSTCNETPLSQSRPRLYSGSLSPELTTLLISRCRQEQTTVHAAICAAFLLAITRQNRLEQPQTLKCFSSMNFRQYLVPAVGKDVGLYACGKLSLHTLTSDATLWDVANSVKHQLKQAMAPDKIFKEIPQYQVWMSTNPSPTQVLQGVIEKFDLDLLVSNLGRLTFPPQFDRLELQAIYGPVMNMGTENRRMLGVATVRNQLFFTLVGSEPAMSSAEAENLQEEAMQLLNAAIDIRSQV